MKQGQFVKAAILVLVTVAGTLLLARNTSLTPQINIAGLIGDSHAAEALQQGYQNLIYGGDNSHSQRAALALDGLRGFLGINPHLHWQIPELEVLVFLQKSFSLESYRKQMTLSAEGDVTIVKSPGYFNNPASIARIHRYNSSIRLICIMRDPVVRLISHYVELQATSSGSETKRTFESLALNEDGAVNPSYHLFGLGRYADHLQHWYEVFPKEQILLIDGDAFVKDPYPALKEAERFLGLPDYIKREHLLYDERKGFYCRLIANVSTCLDRRKGRPHPNVTQDAIKKLQEYYRPYDEKLVRLTGRTFSWMNR